MAEGAGATYITWNLPNWITVLLMIGLGTVVLGLASAGWAQWRGDAS